MIKKMYSRNETNCAGKMKEIVLVGTVNAVVATEPIDARN